MKEIVDPIKTIFFHYCHVECYEVSRLQHDMNGYSWRLDVSLFRDQLQEMIKAPEEYVAGVNELTGNEFETGVELKEWLINIWNQIFP